MFIRIIYIQNVVEIIDDRTAELVGIENRRCYSMTSLQWNLEIHF